MIIISLVPSSIKETWECSPTAETKDLKSFKCGFESRHSYYEEYMDKLFAILANLTRNSDCQILSVHLILNPKESICIKFRDGSELSLIEKS